MLPDTVLMLALPLFTTLIVTRLLLPDAVTVLVPDAAMLTLFCHVPKVLLLSYNQMRVSPRSSHWIKRSLVNVHHLAMLGSIM